MSFPSNRNAIREAARQAYRKGWAPIPVPFRTKNPGRDDWQLERHTEEDIDRVFSADPGNIGILMGEPSGWLIDIDLDCPEALRIASLVLPPTPCRFGRSGAPNSHWLYTVAGALASKRFRDPLAGNNRGTLIEIRSTGGHSLVPPSVHPSGELIAWVVEDDPARVALNDLDRAVRLIAVASLLARHWPKGSRHDAALALVGGLVRANWTEEQIKELVTLVAVAAGDEELTDRIKSISTTFAAIKSGKKASGWPTLASLIDKRIVDKVCEWLEIGNTSYYSYEESTSTSGNASAKACQIAIPAFPIHVFPPRIRTYLESGARSVGCPIDLVAVPFLGYAAAAIGKNRIISIKKRWTHRPILWAGVVAVSGDGKSPADSYARAALDVLQSEADERYQEQLTKYQTEHTHWKGSDPRTRGEEPSPPTYEHWYSTDATVESLAPMLKHNAGIALSCDELVAWARGCSQYKKGGNDRQKYLEIWNGRPLKVDRKTQGFLFVKEPVLCIAGGIQPDRLVEMTKEASIHDGLVQRFLWSYPDVPPSMWSWDESEIDDLPWMVKTFQALRKPLGTLGPLILRPSTDARGLWQSWYDELRASRDSQPPLGKEVISKLPAQLARIWLILESLWHPADALVEASVERLADAIDLVAYFQAHQRRVLVHFGTDVPEVMTGMAGRIRSILSEAGSLNDGWVSRTDIWNRLNRNGTAEQLDNAIATLLQAGLIEQREVATGTRTRLDLRLVVENTSYEEYEEFDEEPEEPANTSLNSYEVFKQRSNGRVCYACRRSLWYADGVCSVCHPRTGDTPVRVPS